MDWIELESLKLLTANIILPAVLSTAASIIYGIRRGWKGIADFLACWSTASFMGVLTHWTCDHYGITGTLAAVIISMAALLSHLVMDIVFHPAIKDAMTKRLVREIASLGARKTAKDFEGGNV